MSASDLRKKRRLAAQGQASEKPAAEGPKGGSGGTTAADVAAQSDESGGSTRTASAAKPGEVGAGLSAPGYTAPGETTEGVQTPAQAFIAAVKSGDRDAIKATYANVPQSGPDGIAAAYEIKDAFFNGTDADRAAIKANVTANKDLFPAKNYADFQTMMSMSSGAVETGMRFMLGPRPAASKPPRAPVSLSGEDALGAVSGMARAVPHTENDVTALADMAYREARGEGVDGMRAVEHVAVNRQAEAGTQWTGKPLTQIVSEPNQFATTGAVDRSSPEWKQAYALAQSVVSGEDADPTKGATYFANTKTADLAALKQITGAASETAQIGNHTFYGTGAPTLTSQASAASLGSRANGLNSLFANRLSAAISAGEAATGSKAQIVSGVRSYAQQAALYQAYKSGTGGIAARPGYSRHEVGEAVDLAAGPVRTWVQEHAKEFGLEPAIPKAGWGADPPHIQLARDIKATAYDKAGVLPSVMAYQPPKNPFLSASGNLPPGLGNITSGLRKGSSGAAAGALQSFLNGQGVTDRFGKSLTADGSFGNRTREALKSWQAKNGLTPDGIVGPQTLGKINAVQAQPLPRERPTPDQGPENVGSYDGATPPRNPDWAAGAAAAAIVVNPSLQAGFAPSTAATLNAAIEHPNETFAQERDWDPAAARIANIYRSIDASAAEQDAAYAKQKADAQNFVAPPAAADTAANAGVKTPTSLAEWVGVGSTTDSGPHRPPSSQSDGDALSRFFNFDHAAEAPIAQPSAAGQGQFGTVTPADPYAPTGGSDWSTLASANPSSFDSFASGMASAYSAAAGGSTFSYGGAYGYVGGSASSSAGGGTTVAQSDPGAAYSP